MNTTRAIPEVVSIVLNQLARMRAAHQIAKDDFQGKLDRLSAKELDRRGLSLLVRECADGHTRFIIKDRATHFVIEMLECA